MPFRICIAGLLFLGMIATGCGDDALDRQKALIDGETWQYQDTLKYQFEIRDTAESYHLVARIRHKSDFRSQNIYTRIHTIQPQGDSSTQVVSFELADHTGRWHGKCRGSDCTVEIVLQENFRVKTPGRYKIRIEQFMREQAVSGIESISLLLLSAGN